MTRRCEPASGSARDDASLLPWRGQLEAALQAACSLLKSPTEMESNTVIAGACVSAWGAQQNARLHVKHQQSLCVCMCVRAALLASTLLPAHLR